MFQCSNKSERKTNFWKKKKKYVKPIDAPQNFIRARKFIRRTLKIYIYLVRRRKWAMHLERSFYIC